MEPAYTEIVKKLLLIIYDLPLITYSNSRNSLDLAHIVLNLLGIREMKNPFFCGFLIYEYPYKISISISAECKIVKDRYITVNGKIYPSENVPPEYKKETQYFSEYIDLYRYYEKHNMLFPDNDVSDE